MTSFIVNVPGVGARIVSGVECNPCTDTERTAACVIPMDKSGNVEGETDYARPIVNTREPSCFASIDESDLTANVYTVTGDPAIGIDVINDSAGEITVTVSDGTTSIAKTLKPDDTYHQTFEIGVETVTFSAGAVFRADLLR